MRAMGTVRPRRAWTAWFGALSIRLAGGAAAGLCLAMTTWSPAGSTSPPLQPGAPTQPGVAGGGTGPSSQYDCAFDLVTDAFTGAYGTTTDS